MAFRSSKTLWSGEYLVMRREMKESSEALLMRYSTKLAAKVEMAT